MLSHPDWGCGELGLKVAGGLNRPASGTACDKRVLSGSRSFGKHLCFPLITLAGRKGECKRDSVECHQANADTFLLHVLSWSCT